MAYAKNCLILFSKIKYLFSLPTYIHTFQLFVQISAMVTLDFAIVILVQNMKDTVTLMTNVKKVSDVEQTIVPFHLDLIGKQIAVIL